MNKFDTTETAAKALVANKKPDCVVALNVLFYQAIEAGKTPREAYYFAETTHFLNDHNGFANAGKLSIEETDEAVHQEIIDTLMAANDDGKAESRIDAVITWYDLVRSWGAPVALAFSIGTAAGQEAWEDENDLDEAEAISRLNEIPTSDEDDEALKETTIKQFYTLRNEGNSVRASLRDAVEQAQRALELKMLFSILGGGLDVGGDEDDAAGLLGSIFGGRLN